MQPTAIRFGQFKGLLHYTKIPLSQVPAPYDEGIGMTGEAALLPTEPVAQVAATYLDSSGADLLTCTFDVPGQAKTTVILDAYKKIAVAGDAYVGATVSLDESPIDTAAETVKAHAEALGLDGDLLASMARHVKRLRSIYWRDLSYNNFPQKAQLSSQQALSLPAKPQDVLTYSYGSFHYAAPRKANQAITGDTVLAAIRSVQGRSGATAKNVVDHLAGSNFSPAVFDDLNESGFITTIKMPDAVRYRVR